MTHEEAINSLKTLKLIVEWGEPMEFQVAIDLGIEALEKQIPKKPNDTQTEGAYSAEFDYGCPNCGIWFTGKWHYCPCCGQAIDWSDEE